MIWSQIILELCYGAPRSGSGLLHAHFSQLIGGLFPTPDLFRKTNPDKLEVRIRDNTRRQISDKAVKAQKLNLNCLCQSILSEYVRLFVRNVTRSFNKWSNGKWVMTNWADLLLVLFRQRQTDALLRIRMLLNPTQANRTHEMCVCVCVCSN